MQTVQSEIIWILQKSTDLDLHYLQKQDISRFSRTRINTTVIIYLVKGSIQPVYIRTLGYLCTIIQKYI